MEIIPVELGYFFQIHRFYNQRVTLLKKTMSNEEDIFKNGDFLEKNAFTSMKIVGFQDTKITAHCHCHD